jgi:hypothetical protein
MATFNFVVICKFKYRSVLVMHVQSHGGIAANHGTNWFSLKLGISI